MVTRQQMIAAIRESTQQSAVPAKQSGAGPSREEMIRAIRGAAEIAASDIPLEASVSKTESGLRGAAQGATLGFADEISGVVEALWEKAKGDPTEFGNLYAKLRDQSRESFSAAQKANPLTYGAGEVAGAVGTMVVPGMAAARGAKAASVIGRAAAGGGLGGIGYSEAEDAIGLAKDGAKGAAIGGAVGALAPYAGKAANWAGQKLKIGAEKAAVNATGATGVQASKFADGAGRELLDQKVVRFGDSQAKIAERAGQVMKSAEDKIDEGLRGLDEKGVNVDLEEVTRKLQKKIQELRGDPSKSDIVKALENEIDNIGSAIEANSSVEMGISAAEKVKRGYNRKAKNWMNPEQGQAGKEAYLIFRDAVEEVAEAADPKLAKTFRDGKKSFGLMAPIEEAAERRALTTSQSPAGGLLDMTSAAGGFATGGPIGAVAMPVARRVLAPRVSSSAAVALDKAGTFMSGAAKGAEKAGGSPGVVEQISQPLRGGISEQLPRAAEGRDEVKAPRKELKGEEKWANDGLKKLEAHTGQKLDSAMLGDRAIRKLLIEASDMPAGSRAMENIAQRIQGSRN